jgi:hypothetical protein
MIAARFARLGLPLLGVAALLVACSSSPGTEHVSETSSTGSGAGHSSTGPNGGSSTSGNDAGHASTGPDSRSGPASATGTSGSSGPTSSHPSPEDASTDAPSGVCTTLDAGVSGDNVAEGSATGPGVDCTFCALGASVYTDSYGNVLFALDGNAELQGQSGDTANATGNSCKSPSGATYLDLEATLYMGTTAVAGTYHGHGLRSGCPDSVLDYVTLDYYPAGTHIPACASITDQDTCNDTADCSVEQGSCHFDGDGGEVCGGGNCIWNQDVSPTDYGALAGCDDGESTSFGEWTVTLTSVTLLPPNDADYGKRYSVHGTFTATLYGVESGTFQQQGPGSPPGPVQVSLTF